MICARAVRVLDVRHAAGRLCIQKGLLALSFYRRIDADKQPRSSRHRVPQADVWQSLVRLQ